VVPGQHPRLRPPELVGRGGWLNTDGKAYAVADCRGRFLLLDFWAFSPVGFAVVDRRFAGAATPPADDNVPMGKRVGVRAMVWGYLVMLPSASALNWTMI
jgi:hypothetical protein